MPCRLCNRVKPINSDGVCLTCLEYQDEYSASEEMTQAVRCKRPEYKGAMGMLMHIRNKEKDIALAKQHDMERAMDAAKTAIENGDTESANIFLDKRTATETELSEIKMVEKESGFKLW